MIRVLVLALVLLARPVSAQDDLPPGLRPLSFTFTADQYGRSASTRDPFDYAVFVYGATAGADWAVTAVCLRVECTPDDPIALYVAGINDPKISVPLGLAIDVTVVIAVKHWLKPKHPALAQVILYSLSTVRLVILTQRIGDLRRNATRTGVVLHD